MKDKKNLLDYEKRKYEKIWSFPDYREGICPGRLLLQRIPVMQRFKSHKIKTLLDAGCGEGTALKLIKREMPELEVMGMDIASNSIDPRLKDIFTEGCLWNMTDYPKEVDAIFCSDVLEHIPEEKVDDVLFNFSNLSRKLIVLSISFDEDLFGQKLINEPLHLTVKDVFWWMEKLSHLDMKVDCGRIVSNNLDVLLVK